MESAPYTDEVSRPLAINRMAAIEMMQGKTKIGWKKKRGEAGEQLALKHLSEKGYRLLVKNFRFERGEVDLIMEDGEEIVFIEVKTRHSQAFGDPQDSITVRKQQQLRKIAEGYLNTQAIDQRSCRFDVVAVRISEGKPHITHLKNAFF